VQDDVLRRIVDGPTISSDVLHGAGALTENSAEAPSTQAAPEP